MNRLLDSFWRAAMYCLHPRVIALSVLPLIIMGAVSLGLAYFFWADAVTMLRGALDGFALISRVMRWMEGMGLSGLNLVLAPTLLLLLSVPVIVIVSLLFVAVFMTPAMVALAGERRFPQLERKKGGSLLTSVVWSLGSTLLAAIALVLSIPLWLIPPLVLVLPPLIWGWLTYQVMSFDALAEHASADERRRLLSQHRWPLLGIGVVTGYLGAAPTLIWAASAVTLVFAPLLIALSVWLYMLVFAFSALWFTHYVLAALARLRIADQLQDQRDAERVASHAPLPLVEVVREPQPSVNPPGINPPGINPPDTKPPGAV